MQALTRGGARHLLPDRRGASTGRTASRRRGGRQAAHERAELLTPVAKACSHRHRRRGRLAGRAGAWRHGLHRGDRRGPALPRRPHRADLRGHQRHPGHRPRQPQAAALGRQTVQAAIAGMRETVDKLAPPECARTSVIPPKAEVGRRQPGPSHGLDAGGDGRSGRARRWRARRRISSYSPWRRAERHWPRRRWRRNPRWKTQGQGDRSHAARVVTARFFAEHLATEAPALEREIVEGAGSIDGAGPSSRHERRRFHRRRPLAAQVCVVAGRPRGVGAASRWGWPKQVRR